MKSLSNQFASYSINHQNQLNLLAHYIGVPAILIGFLLLLNWFTVSFAMSLHITFAWIAVVLLLVYYFRLNVKLALLTTVILVILNLICTWIAYPKPSGFSLTLFIILFVGGWALQLFGHLIEKTKPSFTANLSQLFIAPLYLLVEVLKKFNLDELFGVELPTEKD